MANLHRGEIEARLGGESHRMRLTLGALAELEHAFGLGHLRLTPDAFWSMTPRELAAAMKPYCVDASSVVERSALDHLMRAFPDVEMRHD